MTPLLSTPRYNYLSFHSHSSHRNSYSRSLFGNMQQVRYLELKAKERESGYHPTKLKATVCADLMLKLSSATGRYAKVTILDLYRRLLESILTPLY